MADNLEWDEPGPDDDPFAEVRRWARFIRHRPGMVIGGTSSASLHALAEVLLLSSLAEIWAGRCKMIHVWLNADGSLSLADDGRGISVELHENTGMTTLERFMTSGTGFEARGGENFFVKSIHGAGFRAVTALSDWAEATVCWNGRIYQQRFERGLPVADASDIGPSSTRSGTTIVFHPDPEIFADTTFDLDRLKKQLRELAAACSEVAIKLTDMRTGQEDIPFRADSVADFDECPTDGVQDLHQLLRTTRARPLSVVRTDKNEAVILYFRQKMKVACDRNCTKAWGINNRPRVQLSDDPDDYAFLADDELGDAPADPGTYEGGEAKPLSPDEFPTKWCVRECERCSKSQPGEWMLPLEIRTFDKRRLNILKEVEE